MAAIEDRPIAQDEDPFQSWMDQDLPIRVAVKREGDQWFALLMDFDITGTGSTTLFAVRDAFDLLFTYLHAYFDDDAPFEDALRPIPVKLRLRIEAESAAGRVLRHLSTSLPVASEQTYVLPPGSFRAFAH